MATKKTVSKTAAKPKASGQRRPSRSSGQATSAAAVTAADDTVAVPTSRASQVSAARPTKLRQAGSPA